MRYLTAVCSIFALCLVARIHAAEPAVEPGLQGDYYDMENAIEDYPTIPADKKPTVTKVDKQVNFESVDEKFADTNLSVHFFVRWTGLLRIPKDGKYTLYTVSDDGSRVYIDGKQVVDNGGLHAMEEKNSEELELKAGDHEIKIDFFQNEGGAGCKLLWSTEGVEKQAVPESALFHKKVEEKKDEAKK
jgi:hypothetical protein